MPAIIIVIYLKGYYDIFSPMGPAALIGWMCAAVLFLAFIFFCAFSSGKKAKNGKTGKTGK